MFEGFFQSQHKLVRWAEAFANNAVHFILKVQELLYHSLVLLWVDHYCFSKWLEKAGSCCDRWQSKTKLGYKILRSSLSKRLSNMFCKSCYQTDEKRLICDWCKTIVNCKISHTCENVSQLLQIMNQQPGMNKDADTQLNENFTK